MKPLRSIPVLLLLLSALTVISGCAARKKPVLVVVPSEQPPATAPTPAPTPSAKAEPQKPENSTQASDQPQPTPEEAGKATPEKNQKKIRRHGSVKKPSPIVKAEATPPEIKPEPRSTPAPISPAIPPSDAARDQSSTEQLLQTTENNLNGIKRQLSKDEEARVAQIRSYISQSRQATKDNDPARAYNLAFKANLLCNELVRQR